MTRPTDAREVPDAYRTAGAERVPVLMYHRVDSAATQSDAASVSPEQFGAQLAWLSEHGYRPCRIEDFARWASGQATLPQHSVLITFDDGYAGLETHVSPRLAEHGWPATVFLVSDRLGGHNLWDRPPPGEAPAPLLAPSQIERLAARGIQFHSHSATHADLTTLGSTELCDEVAGSRERLQRLLGHEVMSFAYPYGRANEAVRQAVVAAGYTLGFGVRSGFNRPHEDAWSIRRLDINAADSPSRFGTKVTLGTNDGSIATRLRYVAGRLRWRGSQ